MQDRELVAAIVTGDQDALGEAYDRYAAQLYAYCQSLLPTAAQAADVVADTFTIATAKLPVLSDPNQLGAWLHAVARSECLRRLGTPGPPGPVPALPVLAGALTEAGLPDDLRERVLAGGADRSATGRAHRATVAHRAGAFGRAGFPKPAIPPGPQWWHGVRRRPRAAAGVAAVAIAVVAAGIAALLIAGGTHRAPASTVALGGGNFATSSTPSSAPAGFAGGRSSPSRKPAPTPAAGTPSTAASLADAPTPVRSRPPASPRSSAPARSAPPPSSSPSPSPSPSPTPPPSSSPPPVPGTLRVTPAQLVLAAVKGKAASGTFIVTAVGGPVSFVITSPNAKVSVSPSAGSLSASGSWSTVTVTVRSLVALRVRLTINPGHLAVTVVFSITATAAG